MRRSNAIPVVDIFAGPGGLGEGFSRLQINGKRPFQSVIAIEKDPAAHSTLTLRAFYRQFDDPPPVYFDRLRGLITTQKLFDRRSKEADAACREAWLAELGSEQTPVDRVRKRVAEALGDTQDWVLLGGPPCQAYSLAGRSRNRGIEGYRFEKDRKTTLYLEYLQLIADFWPAVFVMENVKGLLSAKLNDKSMFSRILEDLANPAQAVQREGRTCRKRGEQRQYELFTLAADDLFGGIRPTAEPGDYVVRAEKFGIPQARHRVIIVGIRRGFSDRHPKPLDYHNKSIHVRDVIADLPGLRSGVSGGDSPELWARALVRLGRKTWQSQLRSHAGARVADRISEIAERAAKLAELPRTCSGLDCRPCIQYRRDWFEADLMPCVANHESRTHMPSDLLRYLFAATYAEVYKRSPELSNFPPRLLPAHKNASKALLGSHFADRFRVQRFDHASTTITSHISRDGHYYIHPDPEQCRSLTVREAARLQTFPDTYFFEGNRTAQYVQVGNAVPPLLANQIAERVYDLFK